MVRERSIIQRFQTLEKEVEPKPQIVKNCIRAFLVGGLICDLGQVIMTVLKNYDFSKDEIGAITSICMVFLGALLTGVGIYDKIATYAGAGTVVPITGFSNAIVAIQKGRFCFWSCCKNVYYCWTSSSLWNWIVGYCRNCLLYIY